MILKDANAILQRVLDPMPLDRFLDETMGQGFVKVAGDARHFRTGLLGADPERTILAAFDELSARITSHAEAPFGPAPTVEPAADSRAFRAKIDAFHAQGYTVRLPGLRGLSPELEAFVRALEFVLHQPVKAAAFWSRGDARAPVHYDEYDILVVQLKGSKRWFISTERSELRTDWDAVSAKPQALGPHREVEVGPGDLLYLPRGTRHRVDALEDSIHLSIGFVPLTVREAIVAALDHISSLDRTFRETADNRLSASVLTNDFRTLSPKVREGVGRLLALCGSDAFIAQAMQQRSSTAVGGLEKLKASGYRAELKPDTRLRHNPLAMCHLGGDAERIDFSYPGGHIHVHDSVEQGVAFIADTREFRVRDIPGPFGDDIRLALAEKFLASGFLDLAPD